MLGVKGGGRGAASWFDEIQITSASLAVSVDDRFIMILLSFFVRIELSGKRWRERDEKKKKRKNIENEKGT